MTRRISLSRNEQIIAVVPDKHNAPAWNTAPVFVYIEDDETSAVRIECLHPTEQSDALLTLFDIGALVCAQLIAAVPVKFESDKEDMK